ncbi:MAG: hypothetical protein AVDCRST_MAG89-4394, partial [uncultured Gemmatimonadetes bacterium]
VRRQRGAGSAGHDHGSEQRLPSGGRADPAAGRGRQRVPAGGGQEGVAVPLRRVGEQAVLRRHAQQDRLCRGGAGRARAGRRL